MTTQNITYQTSDSINSLSDILNSLNSNSSNLIDNNSNIIKNENNDNNSEDDETEEDNNSIIDKNEQNNNQLQNKVKLFSYKIDRRLGNYLLNELEKKQLYIDELEEVIKMQQLEISELKSKIDSINKLELLAKLKTNINEKNISNNLVNNINSESIENIRESKIVQVKKNNNKEPKNSEFIQVNPNLVINSEFKIKPITKIENEEPLYNGVLIEKPKENNNFENQELSTKVINQRRRNNRF